MDDDEIFILVVLLLIIFLPPLGVPIVLVTGVSKIISGKWKL